MRRRRRLQPPRCAPASAFVPTKSQPGKPFGPGAEVLAAAGRGPSRFSVEWILTGATRTATGLWTTCCRLSDVSSWPVLEGTSEPDAGVVRAARQLGRTDPVRVGSGAAAVEVVGVGGRPNVGGDP